jgi:hypothetical protein
MCAAACRCPAQHTPPITSKHLNYFKNFRAFRAFGFFLALVTLSWRGSAILY